MNTDKTALLRDLDAVRENLWKVVDGLPADHKITPEWNKRDFFAHIAGWDAMMFEVFSDHINGVTGKTYAYKGIDDTNHELVAHRQRFSLEDAKLECEINRFAIKVLLEKIAAVDYGQLVNLPWGKETVIQFIQGAIQHERGHAEDILKSLK